MNTESSAVLDMLRDHLTTILNAGAGFGGGLFGFMLGRRKADAESAKMEAEAIIAPFRVLIDGYEEQARADNARILDLSREVRELRDEVRALRQALDARPR